MVGTILKNDLQDTIEQQLTQYASGLGQAAQSAQQTIGDTWEDLQRAGRTGVQDVQAQLSDYATQAYNAAQQAQQDALAQQQAQQAAIQQHLTDYANQVTAGAQQAAQTPLPSGFAYDQTQQPQAGAALPHSEEPATATDVNAAPVAAAAAGGPDLGSRWKTQFDFGSTYTGDYRTGTPHRGVDIVPANGQGIGTEVDAFAPGRVTNVFRDPGGAGGLIVYVQDSDGLTHAYMHLANANVKVGDQVQRGTPIAQMGESGTEGSPHLHYEVRKNANDGDPLNQLIDPRPYTSGSKQPGGGPVQQAVAGAQQAVGAAAGSLQEVARQAAQKAGIDPDIFVRQIQQESGFNPGAKSPAGAIGVAQFMPDTARGRGIDPTDPVQALYAAAQMDAEGLARYGGSWAKTLAAYNAGPGAVDKYGGVPPYEETQRYVNTILQGGKDVVQQAVGQVVGGAQQAAGNVINAGQELAGAVQQAAKPPIVSDTFPAGASPMQQLQAIQGQLDSLRNQLAGAAEPIVSGGRRAVEDVAAGAQQAYGGLVQGARQAAEPMVAGARDLSRQLPDVSASGIVDVGAQRRDELGQGLQTGFGPPTSSEDAARLRDIAGAGPITAINRAMFDNPVTRFLSQPGAIDSLKIVQDLNDKYAGTPGAQTIPLKGQAPLTLSVNPDLMEPEDRARYEQARFALAGLENPETPRDIPSPRGIPPRPPEQVGGGWPFLFGPSEEPRPTQILGPGGEVLSTVRPEVSPEMAPGRATEGFRAPARPAETPELRATSQEPPGGPGERAPVTESTGTPSEQFAGNIRLPKYVQQPVRDIIEQVYAADPARFETARRGVVTNTMVQDLADQAGTSVNRVAGRWKPGRAENAETVLALRQALADRALRVRAAQNLLRQNPGSIDARNTMIEAINQHAALQEVVHGVTAEAGRTVAQFREPVTGEEAALSALQRIAKNTGMSTAEVTDHLANVDLSDPASVAGLARTLMTHTFADKAQAIWYFMLLSNPVTQARNILGNSTVLATRPLESLAAAGVDVARAGLTRTPRERFFSEVPAEVAGGISALGPALKASFRTLRTGLTPQDLANPEFVARSEPFQGRLADMTVNAPGRMLAATDVLFRALNQGASLHQRATRQAAREGVPIADLPARALQILRNPDQRLLNEAASDAAYRVFQNKNAVASAVGTVREAMPLGSGRFVLPFVNTPINVGAYALERSPLGLAKLATPAQRTGGQFSDTVARATLGTALAAYVATQAAQGNITGAAPSDPAERDAWQREGKQPYSIKIGDTWYSYAPLQPFSSIIAAGAAAGQAWQKGQNDPTSGLNPASLIALTGVAAGRAMLDQPWLQGMAGLVDALTSANDPQSQSGDPLKNISLNAQRALASAVVPAGVRQLARMFDPTIRTSDPGWEGFAQQIAAGVPGLSQNAPARLNAFGQPAQRPTSGLAALNPFNPSQETSDPVEKELRRLQDGGYDVEPNLVSNRVTLLSEALKLTPDQQRQYQAMAGTMTHDLLEALMQTDAYRNLRSDQQALVINRLSDRVADAARKTLYPSLLDRAVEQKIAETARRQQTRPPDWLIREATGIAEAPTGEAPTGSANRTIEAAA